MKVSTQQMNKNVATTDIKSISAVANQSNLSVNIIINIEDVNDNSPIFVPSKLKVVSFRFFADFNSG